VGEAAQIETFYLYRFHILIIVQRAAGRVE
jgi:hypothetical protein